LLTKKDEFPEFEPDHVKKEERENQKKINENEKSENEKTHNHEFEQHENDFKTTNTFEVDQNNQQQSSTPEKDLNVPPTDPATDIANKQGRNFNH
jgi:hypothetical protein